jgi:hypothetical protein
MLTAKILKPISKTNTSGHVVNSSSDKPLESAVEI